MNLLRALSIGLCFGVVGFSYPVKAVAARAAAAPQTEALWLLSLGVIVFVAMRKLQSRI